MHALLKSQCQQSILGSRSSHPNAMDNSQVGSIELHSVQIRLDSVPKQETYAFVVTAIHKFIITMTLELRHEEEITSN
ncbi:hypothetical protein Bpfe_011178 [Biomphalaria pfeifferi]|uniref:Uncharacterized protein n=1 Tax=Biomphalaria pfeifferi TaxID=112525 RepID=A0AAD8BTA6_BIOPF|nr:hypothetical protein Bpfe_011178 [Biomphalaria pfeifferi]